MKKAVVIFLAMLIAPVYTNASAQETKDQSKPTAQKPVVAKPVAKSSLTIDEDVWIRFLDEPSICMKQAHECMLNQDYKAAAKELSLVGGYLRMSAANATGEIQTALLNSAREIDALASVVKKETLKSEKGLERAFARAEHTLAQQKHARAKKAFTKDQNARGGAYLRSAANHIENGAKWAGKELSEDAAATANGIRELGGKLVNGSQEAAEEVGKGIVWIGQEVQNLGKETSQAKSTVTSAKESKN